MVHILQRDIYECLREGEASGFHWMFPKDKVMRVIKAILRDSMHSSPPKVSPDQQHQSHLGYIWERPSLGPTDLLNQRLWKWDSVVYGDADTC